MFISWVFLTVPHLLYQIFQKFCGCRTKPFLWDIFGQSQTLSRDIFETHQRSLRTDIFFEICSRHLTEKNIFFEIHLRRVKDVTKKISFLRCIWDVLKTSQKRYLLWDVSERSLRCLSQWRSDWAPSKKSHAGWESIS